jgi:4-amino-4-deoxy-L-arabinose transferase-like glycosyltransferase
MKWTTAGQLALVLIVALGLRLAAGWWWQGRLGDDRFGFGDSQSYWTLGRAIARGQPYQTGPESRVFRTPGYPLLLSPIFLLAGGEPSVLWARAESAVCGSLAVAGVWWLARRLYSRRAACWAAWMAALYPGAVALSALVLSESPFSALMLAQLCLWTAAWQAGSMGKAVTLSALAGVTAGAATLVRPSWLLFMPLALVAAVLFGGGGEAGIARRRRAAIGTAMLAGLVLAMAPWWIRNAQVTGHFVPTTLQVGASLYDGLSPTATGASNMDFVAPMREAERRHPAAAGGRPTDSFEYRLDRRMAHEALGWAWTHPGRAAELAAVKLVRLWNLWPNERQFSGWPIRLVVTLGYLPVMGLGLAGAIGTFHRGGPYLLCWLPAAYFTLLHVVFVSSIRYREPAMLALIVLAAGTAERIWNSRFLTFDCRSDPGPGD